MLADVGDAPTVKWSLRDDEGDPIVPASVTATLRAPDGTVATIAVASADPGDYAAQPLLSVAGDWLVTFTAVGPADVKFVAIAALPAGAAAAWSPSLRDVGNHIPSRTRSETTNEPYGTFNDDTAPTGESVSGLIGAAVATVGGMVGTPVVAPAYPLCLAAAALWAAYWVELSFPDRDGNVSVYARLRDDAFLLTEQAKAVNIGAGGGTVDPPDEDGLANNGLSSYYFPAAPRWEYVL